MSAELRLGFVAALTLLASTCLAQGNRDQARELFREAEARFDAGGYREAADMLMRVYELMEAEPGQHRIAYNVGLSLLRAGDRAAARTWLSRFLEHAAPDDEYLAEAQRMLRETPVLEENRGGRNVAATRAPSAATVEPTTTGTTISPIGPILLAVAGAELLASAIVGGVAAADYSSIRAQCSGTSCPSSLRDAASAVSALAVATDVLWVSALAVAATGLVLTFVLQENSSTSTHIGVGPGSLELAGSF